MLSVSPLSESQYIIHNVLQIRDQMRVVRQTHTFKAPTLYADGVIQACVHTHIHTHTQSELY